MTNRLRLLAIALLAAASCLFLNSAPKTAAADSAAPTGITVSPAFQQVSIDSSELAQPVSFTIINNKTTPQTISLSAQDFNSLSETGGLLFVGANPTQLQKKYGLAQWLQLPQKSLTLQPKQSVKITANILNLPSLSAGGHYGALMIGLDNGGKQASGNGVSLHPVASSLLFVTKIGGDTHKLSLANVYVKRSMLRLPGSVTLRFHNDGNTHLIPRGSVSLYDGRQRLISKGIINQDSGIILPGTFRRYSVYLSSVHRPLLPGHYTLNVDFRFDGISQYRRYSTSFFSIPRLARTIEVLIVLVILTVIAWWIVRNYRSYNKK
jgi:hypothetical protein